MESLCPGLALSVLQGLGDVEGAYEVRAFEVGGGAVHFQHLV